MIQKKIKHNFFVALLAGLLLLTLASGQAIAAGAAEKNYTYGMDAYNLGFCKAATGKPPGNTSTNNQAFIDRCVVKVTVYCNDFNSPLYKNACFGKYFGLTLCGDPAVGVPAERERARQCLNTNTFICASQPQASFKTSCENAGKSQLFGINTQDASGNPTPAGGESASEPTTPAGTGSESSSEAEEDKGLTQEEINAQAQELREKLAKGSNTCGSTPDVDKNGKVTGSKDSSTVFDFGCEDVDPTACNSIKSQSKKIECLQRANPVLQIIFTAVKFITYGVGIIITLSIVISGIQYTSAQGDTNTVTKARMRIFNSVIALLLYVFAFAILNYLVPGGLIST